MTNDNPNNARLRQIMMEYGFTRADIARLTGKKIMKDGQCPAVIKWLASPDDRHNYRLIPDDTLELLELKIKAEGWQKLPLKDREITAKSEATVRATKNAMRRKRPK